MAAKRASAAGLDTVTFTRADVFTLPHTDGDLTEESFDHVFVCFLLEHLSRPVEALTRVRSMLKPGGTLTVIEGDHGSTYFHPDSDAAKDAIDCQVRLQRNAGGNPLIGRQLYPLLTDAGYRNTAVSPRMVYVDTTRPDLVDGFIRKTFTAMIEGVREPAIAAGMTNAERFDAGIRDLRRTTEPDGVFCYTFSKPPPRPEPHRLRARRWPAGSTSTNESPSVPDRGWPIGVVRQAPHPNEDRQRHRWPHPNFLADAPRPSSRTGPRLRIHPSLQDRTRRRS